MRVIFAGLLLAATAAAQNPMMGPWWETPIVRDLNLSQEQQQKIRTTVSGSRSKIIMLRATLEAAEADLAELMGEDPIDPKKGAAAIEKVLTARTDLGRQVAQMSLALRQILTASQWHELERRQRRPNPNLGPNHPDNLRPGEGPRLVQPGNPQPQGQRKQD